MRGPPVVLTNTLGRPVTNIISERGAVPMTVVNTLGEPVTLVNSGGEPVTLFNPNGTLWDYPFSLFANNEQGAWYDPSDFSTLYQNSTGTTPVTAVEQPVGLMLDRSRGLVLGAELITNGGFATDSDWTKGASWTISGGTANYNNAGAAQALSQTITLTAGRAYVVTYTVSAFSSGFGYARLVGSATTNGVTITANGAYTEIIIAPASPTTFGFVAQGVFSIDNISVRELPGNHALQATSASRPVLRSRYNLLTQSDDLTSFSIAPATGLTSTLNATTAPTGAATARRLTNTVTTEFHRLFQSVTLANATEHTYTVYLKNDTAGWAQMSFFRGSTTAFANINLATGALGTTGGGTSYSVTSVGNGWYRLSITATTEAAGCNLQLYVLEADSVTANPSTTGTVKSIFVWGAQLLTAADQTSTGGAYQRIAAATDYDTSNPVWRPYLAFDGTDDRLVTGNVDFSTINKVTVWAGAGKLSDAARGMILGVPNTGFNRFTIEGPTAAAGNNYRLAYAGDTTVRTTAASKSAPSNDVLSMTCDLGAPLLQGRLNGVAQAPETGTTGGGNFQNTSINIGADNVPQFFFNGRLYSLAVLGRTATAAELSAMEAWVAGKTGVTL